MPVEKKKHVLTEMDEQKQALVERFAYEELQEEEEESIVSQMQPRRRRNRSRPLKRRQQ
jgi:hypothetical protein